MSRERSILLAAVGATASATVVAVVGLTAALGGFPTEVPIPPVATPVAVVVPALPVAAPSSAPAPSGGCAQRTVAALPAGSPASPVAGQPSP